LFFVDSFELYLIIRALLGVASVSVTYSGLILAIEYVDGVWRTVAGMYNLFPLPISYIIISGIAYLTQDYKNLQLCIGLPGVLLCLLWYVQSYVMCMNHNNPNNINEECEFREKLSSRDTWNLKKG